MRTSTSRTSLFLLALLLPRLVSAAVVVVQPTAGLPLTATQCTGVPTTCAYTMPSQPTAGNLLVAAVSVGAGVSITSVTDTGTNIYVPTTISRINGNTSGIQLWYAANIVTAGSFIVTAHTSAGDYITIFVAEYSGVDATPLDTQAQAHGYSASPFVASTEPSNAGALVIAAVVHGGGGTVTITGGMGVERAEQENTANQVQGYEDLITSAAQTGAFTFSAPVDWAATLAIFNNVSAGGGMVNRSPTRIVTDVGP